MSYLSPINARIEPIRDASNSAVCLYDSDGNRITFRSIRCEYCSGIRKIETLRRLCNNCDRDALQSGFDHEYVCPFGLIEAVIHIPLKNGTMCAIVGKRRPKSNEIAAESLRKAIAMGAPLNYDRMIKAYEKIPFPKEDDFEKHFLSLKEALQALRDEKYLDSFDNETVLQTIRILRQLNPRCYSDLYPLLHWSEPSISRIFRKVCMERFSDFIRERKLVWAEDLLTNSDDSVINIAGQLNYNFMYFQTFFKKFCSITPSDFRAFGFRGLHPLHLPF